MVGTVDDDTITGRGGDDVLTGGDGSDRFVYERLSDLSVWTGRITDPHETVKDLVFQINGGDTVDVLDFSAFTGFTFMGNDTFTATGRSEYRFQPLDNGVGQLILFDQEGDGAADYYLVVDNSNYDIFGGSDPVITNLLNASDFALDYEVGTEADDTLVGLDGVPFTEIGGRMYGFGGDDRLYGGISDDYIDAAMAMIASMAVAPIFGTRWLGAWATTSISHHRGKTGSSKKLAAVAISSSAPAISGCRTMLKA